MIQMLQDVIQTQIHDHRRQDNKSIVIQSCNGPVIQSCVSWGNNVVKQKQGKNERESRTETPILGTILDIVCISNMLPNRHVSNKKTS